VSLLPGGGHLGPRASALLDGQLPEDEAERAWAHVHTCHACRDLVEREGWIKRRLAGLTYDAAGAPERLKGSLMNPSAHETAQCVLGFDDHPRRSIAVAAIGGGAVGAAVMGVLALGAAPASAPTTDRPMPSLSVTSSGSTVVVDNARRKSLP